MRLWRAFFCLSLANQAIVKHFNLKVLNGKMAGSIIVTEGMMAEVEAFGRLSQLK